MDNLVNYALLEGLLFISGEEGIEVDKLKKYFSLSKKETIKFINQFQSKLLNNNSSALELLFYNNRVKLITKAKFSQEFKKFFQDSQTHYLKLTHPSLEVLAIIAYNKNVTKKLIEQYRGVSSDSSLSLLLSLGIIQVHKGTKAPFYNVYRVTNKFFDLFDIKDFKQLKAISLPSDSNKNIYLNQK